MKLDPSSIKRPPAPRREFKVKAGDQESVIVVKKLGGTAVLAAFEDAARLVRKHITGEGDPDESGYIKPEPIPPVDGQTVHASEQAFRCASLIEYAQVAEDHDRYSSLELVILMALDDSFLEQAADIAGWIGEKPKDSEGNSPGLSIEPSTDTVQEG
jgi:hypothetical protein